MDMKSVETHDPNLTAGLTPMEKQFARMNGISEVDFARQKAATASKPTLQDALAGKSTKIKAQPNQKVETQQIPSAKSTQPAQQASRVSSRPLASTKVIPGLGKSSSAEIPRTTGQTQRTPGLTATGTPK